VQVIVTSRLVGYGRAALDSQLFKVFMLEQFTRSQVRKYLANWFALNDMPSNDVEEWLGESESFADVRTNPLLLSFAVQIFQDHEYVPRDRVAIIGQMADLQLYEWDEARGIDSVDSRVKVYLGPMLSLTAFRMIGLGLNRISGPDLVREWTSYLTLVFDSSIEAGPMAREALSTIQGRSWILSEVGVNSSGEPLFSFAHRTFMEYFAARFVVNSEDPVEHLITLLRQPGWHAVIDFALALVEQRAPRAAETFLRTALDRAPDTWEQVERYLEDVDRPRPRFFL
jgi:predicted NACHT family NTPase